MKNKEIVFWTAIIALIGMIILFILLDKNRLQNADNTSISVNNTPLSASNTSIVSKTSNTASSAKSYSLLDVSKHNNQTSCWTIVNGKIYDITSFISSHPAGVGKILKGCGIDATSLYGRVGAHDISKLTDYIVGIIK